MDAHQLSRQLRLNTLVLHRRAQAGHVGSSLSCIELLAASLVLEKRPDEVFILSKAHAALALYTCLHHLGELSDHDLQTVSRDGTRLPAHPAPLQFPSVPFGLGSLGHGLPIAAGIAKADQLAGHQRLTFVLVSDGETNAGTTWEAAHFSTAHRLDGLVVLVDRNGLQGFGPCHQVLGDTAHPENWRQLGFEVVEADGHHLPRLVEHLQALRRSRDGRPKALIANTIKGCGVSYMEHQLQWHYLPMNDEQYQQAREDVLARRLF